MPLIRLLILSLFCSNLHAQNFEFSETYHSTSDLEYFPIYFKPEKAVKAIRYSITNAKGKISVYEKGFNAQGKPISCFKIGKDGEEIPVYKAKYNAAGKITDFIRYTKKGEIKSTQTKKWNDKGHITSLETTNKKGKIINKILWEYDVETECLLEAVQFKKGGQQANTTLKYEYYSPCQKSRTTQYNKHGKVKREWTYDCKEEGELLEKRKNETQICTWEETTDGFLLKVYQSFDDRGRLRKTVSKYNASDSSIVAVTTYNDSETILNQTTYQNGMAYPLVFISYHNGQERYRQVHEYENKQKISSTSYYKEKKFVQTTYSYYDNDLLKEINSYDKKGELVRRTALQYEYN